MDIVPPLVQFRPNALCRRHGRQRGELHGVMGRQRASQDVFPPVVRLPSRTSFCPRRVGMPPRRQRRRLGPIAIAVVAFDNDDEGCPDEGHVLGCRDPVQVTAVAARHVPGLDLRRRDTACGGGVWRWQARWRRAALLRDQQRHVRGEMKRYVKKMSVFMTVGDGGGGSGVRRAAVVCGSGAGGGGGGERQRATKAVVAAETARLVSRRDGK